MTTTSKAIRVQEHVMVHMITNGKGTRGWVHTHGMAQFGLPEIEIRDVPSFMMFAAGVLVNEVCDYMLNSGKKPKLGEKMRVGRDIPFRFKKLDPIQGDEEHFTEERWALTDLEDDELAQFCGMHS